MSDQAMSDLREALERSPDWFVGHSRSAEDHRVIRDAARLLASGRRPDKEEGVRYVREVLEIPASWLTTGDIHQLIDAALGGSDVLIVDIPTDALLAEGAARYADEDAALAEQTIRIVDIPEERE